MKKYYTRLATLLFVLSTLSACAQLEQFTKTVQENTVITHVVLSQTIARYIERYDTPELRTERANKIVAVMIEFEAFVDTGQVSIQDALNRITQILTERQANMSTADYLLAQDLIKLTFDSLQKEQSSGKLPADTQVVLKELILIVKNTARFYQ